MSLLEIKQYLTHTPLTTLGGISHHFRCDPELMRHMLDHWVRKGCVRQFTKTPSCGKKCGQCDVLEYEIYEWNNQPETH